MESSSTEDIRAGVAAGGKGQATHPKIAEERRETPIGTTPVNCVIDGQPRPSQAEAAAATVGENAVGLASLPDAVTEVFFPGGASVGCRTPSLDPAQRPYCYNGSESFRELEYPARVSIGAAAAVSVRAGAFGGSSQLTRTHVGAMAGSIAGGTPRGASHDSSIGAGNLQVGCV